MRIAGTFNDAKAEKRRLEVAAEQRRHMPPDSAPESVTDADETIAAYFARWMRRGEHKWSPATVMGREKAYRQCIHGQIDRWKLRDVTPRKLDDWIDQNLRKGVGYRAVEIAFVTIRAMLGTAAKRRVIEWNPGLAVEFPAQPKKAARRDYLTLDEYGRLLEACTQLRHRVMVRLAAEGAMRRAELSALKWSDLDIDYCPDEQSKSPTVTVGRAVVRGEKSLAGRKGARKPKPGRRNPASLVEGPTKGKNVRVSALSSATVRDLSVYRDELRTRGVYRDNGRVFPSGRSYTDWRNPPDPMTLTHQCNRLFREAKLVEENGKAAFKLHDLRRSAATFARDAGVSEDVIRDQLGHSTTAITRSAYIRTQINPNIADFAAVFEGMGCSAHDEAVSALALEERNQ